MKIDCEVYRGSIGFWFVVGWGCWSHALMTIILFFCHSSYVAVSTVSKRMRCMSIVVDFSIIVVVMHLTFSRSLTSTYFMHVLLFVVFRCNSFNRWEQHMVPIGM